MSKIIYSSDLSWTPNLYIKLFPFRCLTGSKLNSFKTKQIYPLSISSLHLPFILPATAWVQELNISPQVDSQRPPSLYQLPTVSHTQPTARTVLLKSKENMIMVLPSIKFHSGSYQLAHSPQTDLQGLTGSVLLSGLVPLAPQRHTALCNRLSRWQFSWPSMLWVSAHISSSSEH